MAVDKIFFLLLNTIDMWQAISVGVFLIIMNRQKRNSLIILGVFLVMLGLSSLSDVFDFFDTYMNNQFLDVLSFNFMWLIPTLLYLYVESVSIEKTKKSSYFLLIPGGVDLLVNVGMLFLPLQLKKSVEESFAYSLFEFTGIVFGFVLIGLMFKKIRKHSKIVKNQYSSVEYRELKWLYWTIISIIFIFVFGLFAEIFFPGFVSELLISILGLLVTFWIAYNGLLQQSTLNLENVDSVKEIKTISDQENRNKTDKNEKQRNIVQQVKELLEEDKLYLKAELTVADIAKRIGEHPRTVSLSINGVCKENFNRFINRYRVEEAKNLLISKDVKHLNMEGIGMEVGFNSNSSFYSAFKNELNITPLQYLKNSNS